MGGAQTRKGLSRACILPIVLGGMERFAFKGVHSNLVNYLTEVFDMSNSSAAKTVSSWIGLTYLLPLLLAPIIDSCWDRFSNIRSFSFIYVVGLVALTSTALERSLSPSNLTSNSVFLFWSLCLISIGQAGYNPSLQALGAEQLDDAEELPCSKTDQKTSPKTLFFQCWFFGICCGSLLGITLVPYIEDNIGWVLGFVIPSIGMVCSVLVFFCMSQTYSYQDHKAIDGKPYQNVFHAFKEVASRIITNTKIALPSKNSAAKELELQEKPLCPCPPDSSGKGFVADKPKHGIFTLENAKVLLRLLPIWAMLLMFAVMVQQATTFFTKQGMTMERNIGKDFRIPPAALQISMTVAIILLMPLYDMTIIPIARLVTRNEKGITVMQRIGIGMVLCILAMVISAVVETKRLMLNQEIGNVELRSEAVPLSIFWLLPQYILIGLSEVFTVVGMQEFFYSEVPVKMRTMGLALATSVLGVGSFLSAFLITVVDFITSFRGQQSWFSDDMTKARLDKFYWLLAILSTLSLCIYVILCKYHKSRTELNDEKS